MPFAVARKRKIERERAFTQYRMSWRVRENTYIRTSYSANTISVHWTNQWVYQRTTSTQLTYRTKCNKLKHCGKHSWQKRTTTKKTLHRPYTNRNWLTPLIYCSVFSSCCCFFLIVRIVVVSAFFSTFLDFVLLCFALLGF